MKFYHVTAFILGAYTKYPDVGHTDYSCAGYKGNEAVWVAEDDVPMVAEGVTEITHEQAQEYLQEWGLPV